MSGNDCDSLEIGSFYFLSVNLWPDSVSAEGAYLRSESSRYGEVAIFGFSDIPGGLDLFLTDRAWSASENAFVANDKEGEGIVAYTTPPGGISAGIAFGMGNNSLIGDTGADWVDVDFDSTAGVDTYFSLGEDGDQIFLYCQGSDGRDRPISAFSYGNAFLRNSSASAVYGTNNSSAPEYFFESPDPSSGITSLTPGLLDMRTPMDCDGKVYWFWEFQDPCGGCVMDFYELRNAMSNSENWLGTNPDGTFCAAPMGASMLLPSVVGLFLLSWLL